VQTSIDESAFWSVGDLTVSGLPAGGTATISYPTTNAAGQDYDSADGLDGDTNLAESITDVRADVAGNPDLLCFFDSNPRDEYVPPDVNACYRVTARDASAPDYSITVDVRQGAQNTGWTQALRDIQAGTLGAAVIAGQRTVDVGAAFADATAAERAIGKWIRFEAGTSAALHGRAYRILAAADNASNDTVTLVDLRGVAEAHSAGDAWTIEVQGWNTGDPFYLMIPIRVTSATALATSNTDSPVLLNGVVSMSGVFFDGVSVVEVGLTSGSVEPATVISKFSDIVMFDPENPTSVALKIGSPDPATLSKIRISGCGTATCTTHGIVVYRGVGGTIEDSVFRYLGDDCIGLVNGSVAYGTATSTYVARRTRCEFMDQGSGGSINHFENNNLGTTTFAADGASCVRCATNDTSGGFASLFGVSSGAATFAEVTTIYAAGSHNNGGAGSGTSFRNLASYGALRTGSSAETIIGPGSVDHFVVRGANAVSTGAMALMGGSGGVSIRNGLILDSTAESGGLYAFNVTDGSYSNVAIANLNRGANSNTGVFRWSAAPSAAVTIDRVAIIMQPRRLTVGWAAYFRDAAGVAYPNLTLSNLLLVGLHDFGGATVSAALRGAGSGWWDSISGAVCTFDNETDYLTGSGSIPNPTPWTETRNRAIGGAPTYVMTGNGSVLAGIAGCGVKGGAGAPGLSKLTWGQKVNQLPMERATDAATAGGGWLPKAY
jgi:hypothetical protein